MSSNLRFSLLRTLFCTALLFAATPGPATAAEPFALKPDDTIEKILTANKGKRVTVKIGAEELTGVVKSLNAEVLHLGELAGKDFYDAVVPLKNISAVILRVR